jgi:8-oxo-dGTP pyrophosphatase MutT (NUDIX family)
MSDRSFLIDQIKQHKSNYTEESSFKNLFLQLLEEEKCFSRINLSRHITGSAWITDFDREHIVLLHHKKLNKWLQPGGHADGNKDIEHVARKEAMEETGLINLHLAHPTLFDIDIHTIPAKNNVPEHDHYDIRYWFYTEESSFKNLFLQLLEEEKCFSRINLSRHITGSAWITDFDREHIVLLHHIE